MPGESVYELCTSARISGPARHSRPLKTLQVADSVLLEVIVVRAHAGEPNLLLQVVRSNFSGRGTDFVPSLSFRKQMMQLHIYVRAWISKSNPG